jgi:hypothetical protein
MATQNAWINDDGLEVGFGPVVSGSLDTNAQHTKGKTKELQLEVDATVSLPSVGTAHSQKDSALPIGAHIVSARYIAEVDFDNAVEFGTSTLAGVDIDQNGLIATGTTTAVGAGALIGTDTAAASYLVVTATTTAPTVGKGTLIVEYII